MRPKMFLLCLIFLIFSCDYDPLWYNLTSGKSESVVTVGYYPVAFNDMIVEVYEENSLKVNFLEDSKIIFISDKPVSIISKTPHYYVESHIFKKDEKTNRVEFWTIRLKH